MPLEKVKKERKREIEEGGGERERERPELLCSGLVCTPLWNSFLF